MLPVAVGAVGMWESGVWFLAGFPSAEGSVGNSSWLVEFSTLSSARHFHSAWPAVFSRIGTRRPAVARPPQGGSGHRWRVGDGLGRRAGLGTLRPQGHGGLAAESEDRLQLRFDARRELKRIEPGTQPPQFRHLPRVGCPASLQALQRRLRRFVTPPQARAHPLLVRQFHRGQKEILKPPQLVAIQIVDRLPRPRGVVTHVAQQAPHVRPVLLLDVRVVVFLVRPPARELHGLRLAVAVKVLIDELRAIVRIDAAQGKGQGLADRLQSARTNQKPYAAGGSFRSDAWWRLTDATSRPMLKRT